MVYDYCSPCARPRGGIELLPPCPIRSAVEASMKRFFVIATTLVLLVPAAALAQTVTLKLATIVGNDNPFTTSAYKFKEVAEAKSGGRIKVEVYPAGQLAKNEIVQLEGMQLGTVDVGAI